MQKGEIEKAYKRGIQCAGLPAFNFGNSLGSLMGWFSSAFEVWPMILGWTASHGKRSYPQRVYHYTGANGFKGILFSPVKWDRILVPEQFLKVERNELFTMGLKPVGWRDDKTEGGLYCKSVFDACLADLINRGLILDSFKQLMDEISSRGTIYKQWPDVTEYMACFSAARENPIMWEKFAGKEGAVLGFEFGDLNLLFPQIYTVMEHTFSVYEACKSLSGIFNREYVSNKSEVERACVAVFELFSGRFKLPEFSFEEEWRLRIVDNDNQHVNRMEDGRLHVALPKSSLKEVIIHPERYEGCAEEIQCALRAAGYDCMVSNSDANIVEKHTANLL